MTAGSVACRFCESSGGSLVVDLGRQPGSELFPRGGCAADDPLFPLRLYLCAGCGLAQLADDVDVPEDPQGLPPAALGLQAEDAVAQLAGSGMLPPRGTAAEFGSPHGGSWLPLLAARGLEPVAAGEPADVVVDCCFGLMHEADQRAALTERAARVSPGGLLLLQFHSIAAILERAEWNAIRHGHFAYYSVPALSAMVARVGLTPRAAWRFPLYGGTVLLVAQRGSPRDVDPSVRALAELETAQGVLDPDALRWLGDDVAVQAAGLRGWLERERTVGRRVYGYSAASRSVALLRAAEVDTTLLAAVADVAPAKHGGRLPGTDVPVIPPGELVAARPDAVLLFVPDLLAEVRATVPVEDVGGRWVVVDHRLVGRAGR